MTSNEAIGETGSLASIVQEHRVCWDVIPLQELEEGTTRHAGFEIDLYATSVDPHVIVDRGSEEWAHLYRDLHLIAAWIVDQQSAFRFHIEAFDCSVHQSPRRQFRREIALTIEAEPLDHPADDEGREKTCVASLEQRLRQIGARKEHW